MFSIDAYTHTHTLRVLIFQKHIAERIPLALSSIIKSLYVKVHWKARVQHHLSSQLNIMIK